MQQQLHTTVAAVAQFEQEVAQTQPVTALAPDFVSALPRVVSAQAAVSALQQAARDASVMVTSISLRESMPKAEQLGRLEITVVAQGTYPALKQTLAEWLARFPSATVRSQQWRRQEAFGASTGNAPIEASWVLSIWSAPSDNGVAATVAAVPTSAPGSASTAAPVR